MTKRIDFEHPAVRKTMGGVETVGRSVTTARYIADTPNRVLRGLSERGRTQLRAYYRGIRGRDGGDPDLEGMTDRGQDNFEETLEDRDIPNAGAQAAELQRRLDTDEFQSVYEIENGATRRQFTEAYETGEVDSDELGTVVSRYDDMDAQARDGADELLTETGDDGAEFLARADDDTVQRVVADGGIDSYDETMADLLGDDSVDSAMVNRVDDRISALKGERAKQAKDLVDETNGQGIQLVNELDTTELRKFLSYSAGDAGDMRVVLTRSIPSDENEYTRADIGQFSDQLSTLKGVRGIGDLTDDIANKRGKFVSGYDRGSFSSIKGSMREADVADVIATEADISQVRRLNAKDTFDSSEGIIGDRAEIDVYRSRSGTPDEVIDSKGATTFRSLIRQAARFRQLKDKNIRVDRLSVANDAKTVYVYHGSVDSLKLPFGRPEKTEALVKWANGEKSLSELENLDRSDIMVNGVQPKQKDIEFVSFTEYKNRVEKN